MTSYEAAAMVDTTRLEKMVLDCIGTFLHGAIADQVLQEFRDYPYSSITARFKALGDKGLIRFEGTRKGRSGRQQRVMHANRA